MSLLHKDFLRGMRVAVPVMMGFIPVGLILGATGAHAGLSPFGMGLMTGINYAGGSEFAALALWSAFPPILTIAMSTWLINSRHIMLSAALTPYVKGLSLSKTLLVFFFMCDETWALSMEDINKRRKAGASDIDAFNVPFYFGVALTLWVTWWASALAGAAIGTGLGAHRLGLYHGLSCHFYFDTLRHVAWPQEGVAVGCECHCGWASEPLFGCRMVGGFRSVSGFNDSLVH